MTIHDAGTILNPALFDGQVHGGFAQAVDAALYEWFAYDEDGSFLSASSADYHALRVANLTFPLIPAKVRTLLGRVVKRNRPHDV